MKAFTDGSVTGNKGGWAYVIGDKAASGRIRTHDSYDAELMAVVMAIEAAEAPVCLVSDHWGIVKALRHILHGGTELPHKRAEWWKRIYDRRDMLEGVEWMKRCTTPEMRRVDGMAREAV